MRFFKGMKKRLAKKRMRNYLWQLYNSKFLVFPEVDKLYQDCDGFNHLVKDIILYKRFYKKGWIVYDLDIIKENGYYFCGCMHGMLEPAWAAEKIQEFYSFKDYSQDYINHQRKLGWWTEKNDKQLQFVKSGGKVCNELGMPTDEWKTISCNTP